MNSRTVLSMSLVSIGLFAGACERKADNDTKTRAATPDRTTPTTPERAAPTTTDADNTARNRADREASSKTPMDQSNTSADTKITADIRRSIMDDSTLSMNAKNCKIITDAAGVVTLRGPVASQAEKDTVEAKAKAVAGVKNVVNELEVKQN